MDNIAFQNALDKGFDKFHSFVRSTSFTDRATLAVTVGLLASAYVMATTPINEVPHYFSGGGWQFTKDIFNLAATPLATAAIAAYSTISATNNSLTWLDDANGYKAPKVETIDPAKFVGPVKPDGFFKRHTERVKSAVGEVVDRAVDAYDGWDDKGFKGAIKRNLEEFKSGLRAVSMEDAGVYGASVVVAATLFDGVVMNGLGAPVTDLLQSGSVNYGLEALHKFTEIFNKNILMSVQGLTTLAGAKAGLINWDKSRADKKAAAQELDGGGPDSGDQAVAASEPKPDNSNVDAMAAFFDSEGFSAPESQQDLKSPASQVKSYDKPMRM